MDYSIFADKKAIRPASQSHHSQDQLLQWDQDFLRYGPNKDDLRAA